MITSATPPQNVAHTPMDKAVIQYRKTGEDFVELLDHYLSFYPEAKRYTFFGPGFILLMHEETRWDPCTNDPRTRDPYWYVTYGYCDTGNTAELFARLMPYHLDYVGFARHLRETTRSMRLVPTKRILNLLNCYGIKTEETEAASSASASAAPSNACCTDSDPHAEESSEGCEPYGRAAHQENQSCC